MRLRQIVLLLVLGLSVMSRVTAQPAAKADAARLRALFFGRDSDTALMEGARAEVPLSNRSDLKAWYALNLARDGEGAKAISLAEEMTRKSSNDPWSWFALAGALNYARERPADALAAAERALKLLPKNPDMLWIRAQTLAADEKHREEAIAFVDRERGHVKNPAELLVTKAYALFRLSSGQQRDEGKIAAALATFEEARRLDPANLGAWYLPGSYLNNLRRSDEAYPLLKKALALAPRSTAVHDEYWRAINGSRELGADRKREEVEADVTAFLEAHGDRLSVLYAVSVISGTMKWDDRRKACEEKVLRLFADSSDAEWILVSRWRDLEETEAGRKSAEYRKMLADFIARPQHHLTGVLGEAYQSLFAILVADQSASGDDLYTVAQGALKYERNNPHITWVSIPIGLAERKVHVPDAERIAREGIDVLRKKIDSQREAYTSQGEYERAMGWYTSMGHDALGWVLFQEGRFGEAEKELLAAYDLYHDERRTLDHLGRFYLAQKDEAKAENYLVKGLAVQAQGTNPCETSLRSLYEKRRGSLDGFDAYLVALRDAERGKRRDRILGDRIANPGPVPAFDLKDLTGKRVSLDSLKGKVVVVNYWGIWCGWCVAELPEYQKLFEKYANDADVAILTIDNDQNPDDVSPWMSQKKYTFPVLLDDHYVEKTGITRFPTTWFLDQQGRKAFEKAGWSEKLLEEFGWRIEALKGGRGSEVPR